MAKKLDRKRSLSTASRQKSNQNEKIQSLPQHTETSSPLSPKTQRTSSIAPQGDSTSHHLTQTEEFSPAVRSAHNIALLELLDQRPQSLVSGHQRNSTKQSDEGRNLSIRQERELATNLAFLAGISDCPDHIMGVCIEELRGNRGCQIMVSINKRMPSDGDEILEKVQRGFEQIFKRLEVLSAGKSHKMVKEAH